MILTMQDYPKFGIVHTEDKRKLFQIIQQQKQSKSKDGSKRMSSVIARLTSSGLFYLKNVFCNRSSHFIWFVLL